MLRPRSWDGRIRRLRLTVLSAVGHRMNTETTPETNRESATGSQRRIPETRTCATMELTKP
jgi:hypothetical protein